MTGLIVTPFSHLGLDILGLLFKVGCIIVRRFFWTHTTQKLHIKTVPQIAGV